MKTLLKVSKVIQGNFAIFTVVLAALGYFFSWSFCLGGSPYHAVHGDCHVRHEHDNERQ